MMRRICAADRVSLDNHTPDPRENPVRGCFHEDHVVAPKSICGWIKNSRHQTARTPVTFNDYFANRDIGVLRFGQLVESEDDRRVFQIATDGDFFDAEGMCQGGGSSEPSAEMVTGWAGSVPRTSPCTLMIRMVRSATIEPFVRSPRMISSPISSAAFTEPPVTFPSTVNSSMLVATNAPTGMPPPF